MLRCPSLRTAVAGVSLALLIGCSAYRAPGVSITDANLTQATDEAVTVVFHLKLKNPNKKPLELVEFSYRVAIDGRPAFEGRRAAEATLPAGREQELMIPAVIPDGRMGWTSDERPLVVAYRLSGHVRYKKPGTIAELLFDSGVRRPKKRFAHSGVIRVAAPP